MIRKVISCFVALALVTLVCGTKHEELLDVDFEYFPGVGYYLFATNRNWTYAQSYCTNLDARLAVINSEAEKKTILSFLQDRAKDTNVYLGFTNTNETQYVTTEGIPIDDSGYTTWETGNPSGSSDRCGGCNINTGELTDLPCDVATDFVCEHQLWVDYTYVKGLGYYKLHTDGKGWADAYATCKSEGAHLLVINSQAEADAVNEIFSEHPEMPNAHNQNEAQVGFRAVIDDLSADPKNGTYLTIFGSSINATGYEKWNAGQPSVGTDKYCGNIVRDQAAFSMSSCDLRNAFFCEKELQKYDG